MFNSEETGVGETRHVWKSASVDLESNPKFCENLRKKIGTVCDHVENFKIEEFIEYGIKNNGVSVNEFLEFLNH